MATYKVDMIFYIDCDDPTELGSKICKMIEDARNGDMSVFNGWGITDTAKVN